MGVEVTGYQLKCNKCKKIFFRLKVVFDEYMCEECWEKLGGYDYEEAFKELNSESNKI